LGSVLKVLGVDMAVLMLEMVPCVVEMLHHEVLLAIQLDILDVVLLHDGVEALGPTNSHRSFEMGGGSARRRRELQRQSCRPGCLIRDGESNRGGRPQWPATSAAHASSLIPPVPVRGQAQWHQL
jgi:hypothetical protein